MLAATHDGAIAELSAFNTAQIEDEKDKAAFLTAYPEFESSLFSLEDDPALRGSLVSFELDGNAFANRARSFSWIMAHPSTWPAFTGALLACGDYSRSPGNRFIRFGSGTELRWWRELLTGGPRSSQSSTAKPLAVLLDLLSEDDEPVPDTLHAITERWLAAQESFDWRYYLAKYEIMRSGTSGIYAGVNGRMGYQLCMLNRTQMNSRYRDPYLSAIVEQAEAGNAVDSLLFTGYEFEERWMQLRASGTRIRCAPEGFAIALPPDPKDQDALTFVLDRWEVGDDLMIRIDQVREVDVEDRVEKCERFISDLIESGL